MNQQYAELAKAAAAKAYAPYSHFPVGAVLISNTGETFQGCNVENSSYGLSNCAERTAVFKAVSAGVKDFSALYIYGETPEAISPCGACRQVISEFCTDEMPIYLLSKDLDYKKTTISELLPYHFKPSDLEK